METNDLVIEYSDRKVSAWGGMKLMKDLVGRHKGSITEIAVATPWIESGGMIR